MCTFARIYVTFMIGKSIKMKFKALIAECTAYDFKVMLEEKKPKSWLKSVSAFANGLGGSLFFGIDNDGNIKELDDVQHVCETISIRIRDYMDPLPEVEMIPHDIVANILRMFNGERVRALCRESVGQHSPAFKGGSCSIVSLTVT